MVAELNTDKMTSSQWLKLNLAWALFFAAIGFVNLYVAYNYSIEFWGTFKVFGLFGLSFVFIIAQSVWIVAKLGDDAIQAQEEKQ
jgi:intracellular septation protein